MQDESMFEALFDGLVQEGFYIWDDYISRDLIQQYRSAILRNRREGELVKAGVGREDDYVVLEEVRGDYIAWIEENEREFAAYFEKLDELKQALNRNLFLGIRDREIHLAYYPAGGSYVRHVDNFNAGSSRVLSIITYLNDAWQTGDGGELRIFKGDNDEEMFDIEPVAGRMVCFLSEKVVHEVLTANKPRLSVTGWLLREKILF